VPAYDIDPAGVQQVLAGTEATGREFEGHNTTLVGGLDGAGAESSSALVTGALGEFASAQAPSLQFAMTRTGACISAAAQATTAYGQGDEEMAARAAAAAAAAPVPDLPGPR
jgi:hypothetical protein